MRQLKKRERHGMCTTREYRSWQHAVSRCLTETNAKYSLYGGRGITVCDEWKMFGAFIRDMGTAPTPHHTLDRIDVNGNYEPSNCRWATPRQQANNRQKATQILIVGGIKKTFPEWSRETGIPELIIRQRINRDGWDARRAVTVIPTRSRVGMIKRRKKPDAALLEGK